MERFIHEVLSDTLSARKNEPATLEALKQDKKEENRNTKPAAHRYLCGAVRPDRASIRSNRRQHMRTERVKRSSPWRAIRASSRPS